MMGAAIGVSLSATIVPQAALALGIVLGAACLIAIVLYAMRQPTAAVS
jgi:DHA1 family bicyclomycin/chloramphenicol resistance-like MFS transporter